MVGFLKKKIQSRAPSRKWFLVVLVVILATIGCFFPPALSVWLFGAETPLIILSGTEYVSILTLLVSVYFGANVWQKHIQKKEEQFDEESKEVQIGNPVKNNSEEKEA